MPTYPDILNEYVDASERYEVDGLQFVAYVDPAAITPGEGAAVFLYLQNTLDTPLEIELKVHPPTVGRFRPQSILRFEKEVYTRRLPETEVGIWGIPFTITTVSPGKHTLELEIKVSHPKDARKIREPKMENPLKTLPIDNFIGLGLVSVVGVPYTVRSGKKVKLPLSITNAPATETQQESLKETYSKLWDRDTGHLQHQAQQNINKNRAIILNDLKNSESLFVALYAETQQRFADSGLPLRVGEAIALGKLLTYTCHLFLKSGTLQDGLLVPIWERALFNQYPTDNTLQTLRDIGYRHIMRLAIAISFGMVEKGVGALPWSREERDGVQEYIVDALEDGLPLEEDFLYLPLMLAAVQILKHIRLPNEDVAHTIQLVHKARKARTNLFTDEDTAPADAMYKKFLAALAK